MITDYTSQPSFKGLIEAANHLFNAGFTATPEEAEQLKAIVDRLVAPGRGSTADFSDPANSGLIGIL